MASTVQRLVSAVFTVTTLTLAFSAASAHAGARSHGDGFASKPHLVFLLQDDLGHHDLFYEGNPEAQKITANISALAKDGIILESHYVHWHCSPTRRYGTLTMLSCSVFQVVNTMQYVWEMVALI